MECREPTQRLIGEYIFYIYPFSAFKAANISGELVSLISPILMSILPSIVGNGDNGDDGEDKSLLDMDISAAMPSIMQACSSLDGDKVEHLMKTLLTQNRNISFEHERERRVKWMSDEDVDEIFCGSIEEMFMLAIEVIKINFKGFFRKLGSLSGNPAELLSKMQKPTSTDTSTPLASATSN